MIKKRLLSLLLVFSIVLSFSVLSVGAQNNNFIKTIDKQEWQGETVVERPLVVLMDFKDYKYKQFDEKEDWSVNQISAENYNPEFYQKIIFGDKSYQRPDGKKFITMKNYFESVSKGSYSIDGKVFGWYTAKHNAAHYGNNETGDQANALKLVKEAVEYVAADDNIDLSKYDVVDKNDIDGDGNYYEADGVIDCLIVIHAGIGEDWGGGFLGSDAIWPFRRGFSWYAEDEGGNLKAYKVEDSRGDKYKFDDFVIVDQDLEVAVLAHEYGHYLGAPDLYGFSSRAPVSAWSIMGSNHTGQIPGTKPSSFGAYCNQQFQKIFSEKNFESNWQDSLVLNLDQISKEGKDIILDQASLNGNNKDAVKINLPDYKKFEVPGGDKLYFSGKGDNLNNNMVTTIDLRNKKTAFLTFKTWYKIDPYFDFLTIRVRESDKKEWKTIEGNITTTKVAEWVKENRPEEVSKRNPGYGITDSSGGKFIDGVFNLSEYVGKKIDLKFNFWTDGNTPEEGFYLDDIKILADNKKVFFDNAEGKSKFELNGFSQVKAPKHEHYYLLEWRNPKNSNIDKLEPSWNKFSYNPGLLVWYIDKQYFYSHNDSPDQETGNHIGRCGVGIVDAGQKPVKALLFSRNNEVEERKISKIRHQLYDAAFSLRKKKGLLEHEVDGKGSDYLYYNSDTAIKSVFDDSRDYSNSKTDKHLGLDIPNYGLEILVIDESADGSTAKIHIMRDRNSNLNEDNKGSQYIKSISLDKNILTVETNDKSYKNIQANYILGKDAEVKEKTIDLKYSNGKYQGKLNFDDIARISSIIITAKNGSKKAIYNSKMHAGYGVDLSAGNKN